MVSCLLPAGVVFLSTPSARRATRRSVPRRSTPSNFYPRPPRGGRPRYPGVMRKFHYFYPRPPRGGRRLVSLPSFALMLFLSTPSARRATTFPFPDYRNCGISIHALREEGDTKSHLFSCLQVISIHALREEGDLRGGNIQTVVLQFLSTPSARRATRQHGRRSSGAEISIHALREEGDDTRGRSWTPFAHFYPRPPRGGRPEPEAGLPAQGQFLSTPSARRATAKTETKSLFSNKLYNILHEFRRALIYNGSKNYPNHAK